ncbi:arsenate reductase/protein-tyrosine-phosphatase family protein [Microbacterium tumbae]
MNIEETTLADRVARHAALADPVRLQILDLLALGDIAPVELQRGLGVSSNLLAHHLNQLQQAGLIVRGPSEADRRRTYLRVVPGALDGLIPSRTLAVRRVLFVCTGNSARSPLAAALWRDSSDVPVASAGTHPAAQIDAGALAAADRHGLALHDPAPRALEDVLDADDFLVTVCDAAHEELGGDRGVHWSVPDPVRDGSDAAFDAAFADIVSRIRGLAPKLIAAG